jgi:hypothetical protein
MGGPEPPEMENSMPKVMIAVVAVLAVAAGFAIVKDYGGSVASAQSEITVFEMMSAAKDLPVPEPADAF